MSESFSLADTNQVTRLHSRCQSEKQALKSLYRGEKTDANKNPPIIKYLFLQRILPVNLNKITKFLPRQS